jgi:hypothetical protein
VGVNRRDIRVAFFYTAPGDLKSPRVIVTPPTGGRAINALRSINNTEYCPRRFRFTYVASRLI